MNKKYAVLRYRDGWSVVAEADTMLQAVERREVALKDDGGGRVEIVEVHDIYDAYRTAGYERDKREREAQPK